MQVWWIECVKCGRVMCEKEAHIKKSVACNLFAFFKFTFSYFLNFFTELLIYCSDYKIYCSWLIQFY